MRKGKNGRNVSYVNDLLAFLYNYLPATAQAFPANTRQRGQAADYSLKRVAIGAHRFSVGAHITTCYIAVNVLFRLPRFTWAVKTHI